MYLTISFAGRKPGLVYVHTFTISSKSQVKQMESRRATRMSSAAQTYHDEHHEHAGFHSKYRPSSTQKRLNTRHGEQRAPFHPHRIMRFMFTKAYRALIQCNYWPKRVKF